MKPNQYLYLGQVVDPLVAIKPWLGHAPMSLRNSTPMCEMATPVSLLDMCLV